MKTLKVVPMVLVTMLCSIGFASGGPAQTKSAKASVTDNDAAAKLKQDMRKLWTDHVVWTRDYIVAAVGDQPDAQAAAGRLMKNQEDIGNAVAAFLRSARRPATHCSAEAAHLNRR